MYRVQRYLLAFSLLVGVTLSNPAVISLAETFPLSIIHINDFHARFEPTDNFGGTCDENEECIGGLARTHFKVKQLLEEKKDTNVVYFNAGDSFQGTLWYNIGRWNVTSQFLNLVPADAMTLGNHEFDHGVEGVVPFLDNLNTEMLVANMDATDEPTLQGKYKNSTVLIRDGRKIGVIGVILETTYNLANTGRLKFLNESITIKEEAAKLRKEHPDLNIIIVISHCGYDVDKIIAENAAEDVDVIIGSHSHTFLYPEGVPKPGPDTPRGNYPTVIRNSKDGHKVLIVQASAYAKYVGDITVYFDPNGEVVSWEGAPIFMGKDVKQDEETLKAIAPWKAIIDEQGKRIIGKNRVRLDKGSCSYQECNLGNFFADSMVHAYAKEALNSKQNWTKASIGLVNAGALRVPLEKGVLTYSHLVTMSPFENTLTAFSLKGKHLKEALEHGLQYFNIPNGETSSYIMMQVSGLKMTVKVTNAVGSRVTELKAKCHECDIPVYEDVKDETVYRMVAPNFLANGGDGFKVIEDHKFDVESLCTDLEGLLMYVEDYSPIYSPMEGRIKIVK